MEVFGARHMETVEVIPRRSRPATDYFASVTSERSWWCSGLGGPGQLAQDSLLKRKRRVPRISLGTRLR